MNPLSGMKVGWTLKVMLPNLPSLNWHQSMIIYVGKKFGHGSLYRKAEGYRAKERLVYRGGWKNDVYHGQGTLFWCDEATAVENNAPGSTGAPSTSGTAPSIAPPKPPVHPNNNPKDDTEVPSVIHFVGRFRNGFLHGRGIEFDNRGEKVDILCMR